MILIFGKPACPFCEKAKAFCEQRNLEYEYKSLGEDFSREWLLEEFPGAKTVPQIVVNGLKIGGYTELTRYVEETGFTGTGHTL